jgi:hypothetical protein
VIRLNVVLAKVREPLEVLRLQNIKLQGVRRPPELSNLHKRQHEISGHLQLCRHHDGLPVLLTEKKGRAPKFCGRSIVLPLHKRLHDVRGNLKAYCLHEMFLMAMEAMRVQAPDVSRLLEVIWLNSSLSQVGRLLEVV